MNHDIELVAVAQSGTVTEQVRSIADDEHPWIPGARADLIRDIADLLETQEAQIARLEVALRGAGVPAELVELIKVGA